MDSLVQLRWQLVRSLEFSQGVEAENISLRKSLLEKERLLEVREKQLANDLSNKAKDDQYKANLEKLLKWIRLLKEFQGNMRANYAYDKGVMVESLVSTKRDVERVVQAFSERASDDAAKVAALQKQYEDALLRLDDAQELTSGRAGEVEKLRAVILSLNERMSSLDMDIERFRAEREGFNDKYQALYDEKDALYNKYDLLNAEQKRLRLLLAKTESDAVSKDSENTATINKLKLYYETTINSLHTTNGSLNETIVDLQNQIDKLTFSLMGKSNNNFAKFVELKNENVHLHKTLNNVINTTKVKGAAGSAGIEGITGAPKASNRIAAAAPASSSTHGTNTGGEHGSIGNTSARSVGGSADTATPSDRASFETDRSKMSSINFARNSRFRGEGAGQKINISLNIPAPPAVPYIQSDSPLDSSHSKAYSGPSPRQGDAFAADDAFAGNGKITIGVPLLNKQARELLKGRIVV